MKDILKEGAKLNAQKVSKKECAEMKVRLDAAHQKVAAQIKRNHTFTWEQLHRPMDF